MSHVLSTFPGHDDRWTACIECRGLGYRSTCGYPAERNGGEGGPCCGACEDVECQWCSNGEDGHAFGTTLVVDDFERPFQGDLLGPVDFAAIDPWWDYPQADHAAVDMYLPPIAAGAVAGEEIPF